LLKIEFEDKLIILRNGTLGWGYQRKFKGTMELMP
jgi:hypothetical protein